MTSTQSTDRTGESQSHSQTPSPSNLAKPFLDIPPPLWPPNPPPQRHQAPQPRTRKAPGPLKPTSDYIHIRQLNVCVKRHAAELSIICHKRKPHILCLQETHLKHRDKPSSLPGLMAVSREDRMDGYGGIITYISNQILHIVVNPYSTSHYQVQICTVSLGTCKGKLTVANVYAAPRIEPKQPRMDSNGTRRCNPRRGCKR